jgi:glycosyltransferase involved in cell wall biosynthesis
MPRLLILCEYPTLLGGERSMLATLPAVAAAGFDIHVAAPPGGPLVESLVEHGIPHIPLRTHDDRGERLQLPELRPELAALIQRHSPDLVHANSLSMARIAGPAAAKCKVPSIGHLRDIIKLSQQAVADLNSHRLLIAVSEATRNFHVAQGVDGQKCLVAYNGVDLEVFQPRQPTGYLQRELGLPATARFIATIGQLGLRKGTDVALAAAARVAADSPDVHWLIVGERTSSKDESREFEANLRSAANESPLTGRVHFLGQRRDVRRLLTECVLLVHAARQEPLGRVLLESSASGLPVIATDVGGTREIFPAETDGALLVPVDDSAALADAITRALSDDPCRQLLGAGGRRRAERRFDIRQASARLVEIYQSMLT